MYEQKNTLKKEERVSGKKDIDRLFAEGESFLSYPLRVVYLLEKSEDPKAAILVNVSKKKFKQATKRNRLKRLMRESYRLNKMELLDISKSSQTTLFVAFLYIAHEMKTYQEVEKGMKKALNLLQSKLS